MSFFEPRLAPLPETFFGKGEDTSPMRSALRRSASFAGYIPHKLLAADDQNDEVAAPDTKDGSSIQESTMVSRDDASTISTTEPPEVETIWPPTPNGDERQQIYRNWEEPSQETWMSVARPLIPMSQMERNPNMGVQLKVKVRLEDALSETRSCDGSPLGLPLESCVRMSDYPLESYPQEMMSGYPNCVPVSGMYNSQLFQYTQPVHQPVQQPMFSESAKPKHQAHVNFGSRKVQAGAVDAGPSDGEKPKTSKLNQARAAGAICLDKAREIVKERVKNQTRRGLMPAVDMKPRSRN